jgi:aspartyl-tRNA(Asn)/glutamyl-tRNA(Gln) amidotransferase subunit A
LSFPETAHELAAAVREKRVRAIGVTRSCLNRIAALDGELHCFLHVCDEYAIARATKVDRAIDAGEDAGLLAGVPIAIKDNICTTSSPTTCGSKMLSGFTSGYDAHVVELLEREGAIIVGKTNLDEFSMGSSAENSAFGPTHNPWDTSRVPGGSSGGSAAAVAARMVYAALGSDTGGSIRQPAAYCGVVGVKPSYGRVSRRGLVSYGSSLDQVGPITRCVRDAALIFQVISENDARDATCNRRPVPAYSDDLSCDVSTLRIGLCEELLGEGLDSNVRDAVRRAVSIYTDAGAKIVPVTLPHAKYATACYYLIATAEASSNLARFTGVHYGNRSTQSETIEDLHENARGEFLGIEVKRRILLGTYALSSGYYDQYYRKASKVRTLISQDFDRAFEFADVVITPVAPTTAFPIGDKVNDPLAMYLSDVYTISANLAGICAASIPCGFDAAGLPIGLQLAAPAFAEQSLLAIANAFQQRTDYHRQYPPLSGAA